MMPPINISGGAGQPGSRAYRLAVATQNAAARIEGHQVGHVALGLQARLVRPFSLKNSQRHKLAGQARVPTCRPESDIGRAAQGDLLVAACMGQCQPERLSPGLGVS